MPMDNDTKTSSKDKVNAIWSRDDESILIRTLKRPKEDSKWGNNNPKEAAWMACVAVLLDSKKISGGAPKSVKVVKRRWQCVRAHALISCIKSMFSCLSSDQTGI